MVNFTQCEKTLVKINPTLFVCLCKNLKKLQRVIIILLLLMMCYKVLMCVLSKSSWFRYLDTTNNA